MYRDGLRCVWKGIIMGHKPVYSANEHTTKSTKGQDLECWEKYPCLFPSCPVHECLQHTRARNEGSLAPSLLSCRQCVDEDVIVQLRRCRHHQVINIRPAHTAMLQRKRLLTLQDQAREQLRELRLFPLETGETIRTELPEHGLALDSARRVPRES